MRGNVRGLREDRHQGEGEVKVWEERESSVI